MRGYMCVAYRASKPLAQESRTLSFCKDKGGMMMQVINMCTHKNQTIKIARSDDRKFHGHCKYDRFVFYEYIIKQCSSFYKYTDISVMI